MPDVFPLGSTCCTLVLVDFISGGTFLGFAVGTEGLALADPGPRSLLATAFFPVAFLIALLTVFVTCFLIPP